MAIIKKTEVLPERNVIVLLYGTPGCGKTSASVTSDTALLIDTDRGVDRAVSRCDTLLASSWEDIISEKDAIRSYKTVILDTAKAALDDFISDYVVEVNPRLRTNGLKRFGQMAEEFKAFVNFLRSNQTDVIFICHDKETQDGDAVKHAPDCTGQSKDLLLRISDQVGYVSKVNNKRAISWEPTDNYIGKNVAGLPLTMIPDSTDKAYTVFMQGIIDSVKKSIARRMNNLDEYERVVSLLRSRLSECDTEQDAAAILQDARQLPLAAKGPFFHEMKETLEQKGFVYANKKFTKDETDGSSHTA